MSEAKNTDDRVKKKKKGGQPKGRKFWGIYGKSGFITHLPFSPAENPSMNFFWLYAPNKLS